MKGKKCGMKKGSILIARCGDLVYDAFYSLDDARGYNFNTCRVMIPSSSPSLSPGSSKKKRQNTLLHHRRSEKNQLLLFGLVALPFACCACSPLMTGKFGPAPP